MAKSSLLSAIADLESQPNWNRGFPCKMQAIYSQLTSEEAAAVERAVMNKDISIRKIIQLLLTHDIKVGYGTIQAHRRRKDGIGCKCPFPS